MIKLFNSITSKKEEFTPHNPNHITIYVCGPTVYDRIHLGNARSVVIYDLWWRLLNKIFPKVTYIRNITDVDDKIDARAKETGISATKLTHQAINWLKEDLQELQVLDPTFEPKASEHIEEMIEIITKLLQGGHAYIKDRHVLFAVESYKNYGSLSNRLAEDMLPGARVEVADYKNNPLDFVLWKPADSDNDPSLIFDSPWGKGRPGWHIECSAMSNKYLGCDFDIHGGGADLKFPHHENETAQSICAYPDSHYAKYWLHNGFLTIGGEKMSKSLKNFVTPRDLLGKGIKGIVIRYVLLTTHYRKPFDFNDKNLEDGQKAIDKFYSTLRAHLKPQDQPQNPEKENRFLQQIINSLSDDLNTPLAFATLHALTKEIETSQDEVSKTALCNNLKECLEFLGLYQADYLEESAQINIKSSLSPAYITEQIELRKQAKLAKNWQLADQIRNKLAKQGIILEDQPDGTTIIK